MYSKGRGFQIFAIVLLAATAGLFGFTADANAQATITSATTGNWSAGATWAGDAAPAVGDNIVISSGHTITFDADAVAGTYGTLDVRGTSARDAGIVLTKNGLTFGAVTTAASASIDFASFTLATAGITVTGELGLIDSTDTGTLRNSGPVVLLASTPASSILRVNGSVTITGAITISGSMVGIVSFAIDSAKTLTYSGAEIDGAAKRIAFVGAGDGTLDAAKGLTFTTGGIVANVDITINAPVTWSEDLAEGEDGGELIIDDGVTVTTDDVFTVGTTTLDLMQGDGEAGETVTLTGSGTLSITVGGGITNTATTTTTTTGEDGEEERVGSLKLTTNIALSGELEEGVDPPGTVTITSTNSDVMLGGEDRVISTSRNQLELVLVGVDQTLVLGGTIALGDSLEITAAEFDVSGIDAIGATKTSALTIPTATFDLKNGVILGSSGGTLKLKADATATIGLTAASTDGDVSIGENVALNLDDGALAVSAGNSLVLATDGAIRGNGVINLRGTLSLESEAPFGVGDAVDIELRPVAASAVISTKITLAIPTGVKLVPATDFTVNVDASDDDVVITLGTVQIGVNATMVVTTKGGNTATVAIATGVNGIQLGKGSELRIDGGGTRPVVISEVTFYEDGGTIAVNANAIITVLENRDNKKFTIDFSDPSVTLEIAAEEGLDIGKGSMITVSGTGGTLQNDAGETLEAVRAARTITMEDSSGVLMLNSAGLKIVGILNIGGVAMADDIPDNDPLAGDEGIPSLVVGENAILDGTMTVEDDSASINIASGKRLMYRGGDVDLGDTYVFIEGGGTFDNVIEASGTVADPIPKQESALVLGDENSLLTFTGGGTVDSIRIGNPATTIRVDGGNGTVTGLFLDGNSVGLDFMTDNTLTIDNENTLGNTATFIINPQAGEGTLAGAGKLLVQGEAKFDNQTEAAMTVSKPIELGEEGALPGIYESMSDIAQSGAITVAGDAQIIIADGKRITYTGAEISNGGYAWMMTASGRFENDQESAVSLDSSKASIVLAAAGSLGTAKIGSQDDTDIMVTSSGYLGSLLNSSANVRITLGTEAFHLEGETTVADADTLFIKGDTAAGSLIGSGALKAAHVQFDAAAAIKKELEIGNATTDGVLDVVKDLIADTVMFGGDASIINQATLTVEKLFGSTADAVVQEDSSMMVTVNGMVRLDGDLTLTSNPGSNRKPWQYTLADIDSIVATVDGADFIVDSSIAFTEKKFAFGGSGSVSISSPVAARTFVVEGDSSAVNGTVAQADDDTLRWEKAPSISITGILRTAGESSYAEIMLDPDRPMVLDGELQAYGGTLKIISDSEEEQQMITMGEESAYRVNGGTLQLAGGDSSAVTDGAEIEVLAGVLRGDGASSVHIVGNDPADDTNIKLIGGVVRFIRFSTVVSGTSEPFNLVNYIFSVFVSVWADEVGDGSFEKPYQTIQEGMDGANGGEVRIAAGTYNLVAPLVLDSIRLVGASNRLDFAVGAVRDSWGEDPGVSEEAPMLVFTNALGPAIQIKSHNAILQGLSIAANDNGFPVVAIHDDSAGVLTNVSFRNNNFIVNNDQSAIWYGYSPLVGHTTSVQGLTVDLNTFSAAGDGSYHGVHVNQPDQATSDVTVMNNEFMNASPAVFLSVGGGNVGGVDVLDNTFIGSDGLKAGRMGGSAWDGGLFGSIAVTGNKFTGSDYAFFLNSTAMVADFDGTISELVSVTDNHFFFADDASGHKAVTNYVSDETVTADNYIHAENNWWGSSRGPGQAGGADASDRVDTSPWIIIPQLGAGELFVTDVAAAFTFAPIRITVYSGDDQSIEFETNFAADVPDGRTVVANTARAVESQTYYITPKETKEGAVITVKGTASTGSTNMFDITELVIAGVGNTLAASDWPDDAGEHIALEWTASPNHTGNGNPEVTIDYYQIYTGLTNDIGAATLWAVYPATPITGETGTTIRVRADAFSSSARSYYWVGAVKGELPPGFSATVSAARSSVPTASQVDQSDALFENRIVSLFSNANLAFALDNTRDAGDYVGNRVVELDDFHVFAAFFSIDEEVETAFDLNGDGKVGILDLIQFAQLFAEDNPAGGGAVAQKGGIPAGQISNLFNFDSVYDSKTEQMEFTVLMNDVEPLGGYGFDVVYDSETFELVEIVNGTFLEENGGSQLSFDYKADGIVTIASVLKELNENTAVSGDGIAATLKFKWLGNGAGKSLQITRIQILDAFGSLSYLASFDVLDLIPVPLVFELKNNYPNPFNPTTTIEYALPHTELVRIDIVNVLGQIVTTLVNGEVQAGFHTVVWNGKNTLGSPVASGIYLYKIKAGTFTSVKRLTLLK